jgi:hypothetical protein
MNGHGAVEEHAVRAQWGADDENGEEPFAFLLEPGDGGFDAVEQRILEQQIVDGVAGEGECRPRARI